MHREQWESLQSWKGWAGLGGKNWLGAVRGMGDQRAGGGPFSLTALDRTKC